MKKKTILFTLCFILITSVTSITALADTGPKPSVVIKFKGLEAANCYVTLLSKAQSTGPYSAYDGNPEYAHYDEADAEYNIWQKFVSYKDADGFYFLQYFTKLDNGTFKWTYYPPQEFKILIYFPDSDGFTVSSSTYERYAFDSYYTVDASGLGIAPSGIQTFSAVRSYDYGQETLSLMARTIITIILELIIALLFGFRSKKALRIIGITNVVTQTVLNVLLNIINYSQGQLAFVFNYTWLELLVFAIEACVYYYLIKENNDGKKRHVVLYALTANAASFAAGLIIAHIIPGIF